MFCHLSQHLCITNFNCDSQYFQFVISDIHGPAIPTHAPAVDLSQYPDDVAAMKKMLVDKDAKIRALTARLKALNKKVPTDDIDKLDIVQMLDLIYDPTMDKHGGKFLNTAGYRLVDLKLFRMALEMSQSCNHGKLTLAEMSPDVKGNREDLVTRLAFVCKICGPKVIFPTSPFSNNYPSNYSVNKLLLPLIGPYSYFHLVEFLQNNAGTHQEMITPGMFLNHQRPPHLLLSADKAFYDFARPFDPPLPTDPDANIMFGGAKTETIRPSGTCGGNGNQQIRLKPYLALRDTPRPPSAQADQPSPSPMKQIQTMAKSKGAKTNIRNGNSSSKSPVILNTRKKLLPISEEDDEPVIKKVKKNGKEIEKKHGPSIGRKAGKTSLNNCQTRNTKVSPVINRTKARDKYKGKKGQEGKGNKIPKLIHNNVQGKELNLRQKCQKKKKK